MSHKKRQVAEKVTSNITELDQEQFKLILANLDLKKYCPKKMFEIIFVTETDKSSADLLKSFVYIGKEYEDISSLTFITADDVKNMMENTKSIVFPASVKEIYMKFTSSIERDLDGISAETLATLIKFKLIEVMYKQYASEVAKMRKRNELQEFLHQLTRECVKKKKGEKGHTSDTKKQKGKTNQGAGEIDYSTIPLVNGDEITFEENVYNHISFYVVTGFYCANIFRELLTLNVPIISVMQFRTFSKDSTSTLTDFEGAVQSYWLDICKQFYGGIETSSCLEDTILMKFSPSATITDENLLKLFEEFLDCVRSVVDIKLSHLNYIRHTQTPLVLPDCNLIPSYCLMKYNKCLENVPLECSNHILILNSLIEEVCFIKPMHTNSHHKLLSVQSISEAKYLCSDPFSFKIFSENKLKGNKQSNQTGDRDRSFFIHDHDELTLLLKSYTVCGVNLYNITKHMLKLSKMLQEFDTQNTQYSYIEHRHDRDPEASQTEVDQDKFGHFLYIFLFKLLENKSATLKEENDFYLAKYLILYEHQGFETLNEQESHDECDEEEDNINLYDTSCTTFVWKEKLTSDVLLKSVYEAESSFLYADYAFSPETDTLLIRFHDNLDKFGVNVKIIKESLRTNVCLRDFCRYIVEEDYKWLCDHEPPKYKNPTDKLEECLGKNVISGIKMFDEYKYLLQTKDVAETDEQKEEVTEANTEINITFSEYLSEIVNYPNKHNISQECGKLRPEICSYDLGHRYFLLIGTITTFVSHDGVKVTVDNTRLSHEPKKCSVNITCDGNNLILHSNELFMKEIFTFNMNLKDGTIICFNLNKKEKYPDPVLHKGKSIDLNSQIPAAKETEQTKISEETITNTPREEDMVETNGIPFVHSVDKSFFEGIMKSPMKEEGEEDIPPENAMLSAPENAMSPAPENDIPSEPRLFLSESEIYLNLQQALEEGLPIYKVGPNLRYFIRHEVDMQIPATNLLKYLPRNHKVKPVISTTKMYTSEGNTKRMIKANVDFRICFPSGLYVTTYPSVLKATDIEIKQEYVSKEGQSSSIRHEEFRLFTREGFILIKKIDGTITIFRSNGEILDLDKPDSAEMDDGIKLKPCRCRDPNDYRKILLKKIKKYHQGDDKNLISRRGNLRTKRKGIPGYTFGRLRSFKVPYLRKTITKFDGRRIKFEGIEVSQKEYCKMTCQHDFSTDELYYERGDGMRALYNKSGTQEVQFPDGTRILSVIVVNKDLVDGFVYVSLTFKFDHPNYATVCFDSDKSLEISLKNQVFFKQDKNHKITVNIEDDISTTITNREIALRKGCLDCDGKCTCRFDIKPFWEKRWDPNKQFLQVTDSYHKNFSCDFVGNCSRNSNYHSGANNVFACNHKGKMTYKKLFVVNRDLNGHAFLTSEMVEVKKQEYVNEKNTSIQEYKSINNKEINVLDLRKQIVEDYSNRFLSACVMDGDIALSSHKKEKAKVVYCTTFRQLYEMLTLEEVMESAQKFEDSIQNYDCGGIQAKLVKILKQISQDIFDALPKEPEPSPPESICECDKTKVTMDWKISKWKKECEIFWNLIHQKDFPNYFTSRFCRVVK